MPMYQFFCEGCGRRIEEMRPMADCSRPVDCCYAGSAAREYGVAHVKTSNTFLANRPMGGAQFGEKTRDHYLRTAAAHGVSTDGKAYDPRIARFPGDPEAWVQSPDDVRAVIERRGWSCDGDIKVSGPERAPAQDKPLADDLVAEKVETILEEKLGPDFTRAEGPIVERAVEDVMNKYAQPAHLLKERTS